MYGEEEDFDMMTGNKDSKYEFPAHEKEFVHARLDATEFDQKTGKKLSAEMIQKFTVADWKQAMSVGGFAQYKVEILHDPTAEGKSLKGKIEYVPKDASNPNSLTSQNEIMTGDAYRELEKKQAELDQQKAALLAGNVLDPNTGAATAAGLQGDKKDAWDKGFKKADYQEKYAELYDEAPVDELTIPDLKSAIEGKLAESTANVGE